MTPTKIKKLFLIIFLAELLFAYAPAFAQSSPPPYDYSTSGVSKQIEAYLCSPTGSNGGLYQCINQLYKFAIILASVLGVFFIVIAGYVYMSAEGNNESVEKAKSILESTIVSLVILFGGYIFLNTLNPDLVQFHGNTLQPVVITGPTGTGAPVVAISGYNIGRYDAGEPGQSVAVQSIYNKLSGLDLSSSDKITQYMNNSAKVIGKGNSPLTGQMVLNSASKYNVDFKLVMALMEVESHYGSDGARAINNFNPGNVGNTAAGTNTNYGNWEAGVDAVASWLNKNRT